MWVCFRFGGGKRGNLRLMIFIFLLKYEVKLLVENEGRRKRGGEI